MTSSTWFLLTSSFLNPCHYVRSSEKRQWEKVTECQGPVNTTNTTLPLHPLCVWEVPPYRGVQDYQANRHRTNTCTQSLVSIQQHCLKTFTLACWWERSSRSTERGREGRGTIAGIWLKYEDKQAVFHYSQRWHCSGCRTEATRSVGSRTQRDL